MSGSGVVQIRFRSEPWLARKKSNQWVGDSAEFTGRKGWSMAHGYIPPVHRRQELLYRASVRYKFQGYQSIVYFHGRLKCLLLFTLLLS